MDGVTDSTAPPHAPTSPAGSYNYSFIDVSGGFSAADHSMMRTSRKVRVLYHVNGKHTECSEITLRSIDDLEGFLQRNSIRYLGMESSFFPFKKFAYRFDPN